MDMIPLSIPNLTGNEARYLQECIESGFVSTTGPYVGRLEEMVAAASGAAHAVSTSSGTAALHTALICADVGRDELVIAPSLTFIATANAISHCGASPWILDVEQQNWTLDPALLEQVLREDCLQDKTGLIHCATGRRVAAIMPVYLMGLSADIDRICVIAKEFNLPVIVDAAAALGLNYKDRKVAESEAFATCFSFNGNKTITAGGGGMVVFQDADIAAHAMKLTTTARKGLAYEHEFVAYNYRMTNVEAAIACAQMERLDTFVKIKRETHAFYRDALADLQDLQSFPESAWGESACWFTGLVSQVEPANRYIEGLREAGIMTGPFWMPLHLQPPYKDCPATPQPVADDLWTRIITLPCSTNITGEERLRVVGQVRALHG